MAESLAQLIKRERARRHLSQKGLARESGIPAGTIAAYETEGTKQPRIEQRERLARALDIPVAEIDAAIRGQDYEPAEGESGRAREFGRRVLDIMREMAFEMPVYHGLPEGDPVGHIYLPRRNTDRMDRIGIELTTAAFAPQFNKGDILDVDRAGQPTEGKIVVATHNGELVVGRYHNHNRNEPAVIGAHGSAKLNEGDLIGLVVGRYENYSSIPLV